MGRLAGLFDAKPSIASVSAWLLRQEMLRSTISAENLRRFVSTFQSFKLFEDLRFDVGSNQMLVTLPGGTVVRGGDLSEGERSVMAIVGHVMMQAGRLGFEDPFSASGLVMIDEIDEHLHPGLAQRFLPTLITSFPNLQWIVTSHSPQVWQSAPEGSVHRIVPLDDHPHRSKLEVLEYTEGATAQVLLDAESVPSRPADSPAAKGIVEYEQFIEQGTDESDEAVRAFAELRSVLGSGSSELVRLKGAALLARRRAAEK